MAAVESPIFQPAMRIVNAITNGVTALIITSFDHDYKNGLIVSFRIPKRFGMPKMNNLVGTVTVVGTTTFTVDIDTSFFNAFMVPAGNKQSAQVIPIAEVSETLLSATENVLPFT